MKTGQGFIDFFFFFFGGGDFGSQLRGRYNFLSLKDQPSVRLESADRVSAARLPL